MQSSTELGIRKLKYLDQLKTTTNKQIYIVMMIEGQWNTPHIIFETEQEAENFISKAASDVSDYSCAFAAYYITKAIIGEPINYKDQ